METIGVNRVMDRLLDNPNMRDLKKSSVAAYVKDLISIVNLPTMLVPMVIYLKPIDGIAILPDNCGDKSVEGVFYCDSIMLPEYFNKSRLASMPNDEIPDVKVSPIGVYRVEYGSITVSTDIPIKVLYKALPVDENGFPVLPYDGSLMQAVENYVKYRYYTILSEIDKISVQKVQAAHKEYTWYIGQYISKANMLSYDEAVAWANSWQRLVDTRNLDSSTDGFGEHLNI